MREAKRLHFIGRPLPTRAELSGLMHAAIVEICVSFAVYSALGAGTASALVFGPSNLPIFGYPDPRCYAPSTPSGDDQCAWDSYRSAALRYIDCGQRLLWGVGTETAVVGMIRSE